MSQQKLPTFGRVATIQQEFRKYRGPGAHRKKLFLQEPNTTYYTGEFERMSDTWASPE